MTPNRRTTTGLVVTKGVGTCLILFIRGGDLKCDYVILELPYTVANNSITNTLQPMFELPRNRYDRLRFDDKDPTESITTSNPSDCI